MTRFVLCFVVAALLVLAAQITAPTPMPASRVERIVWDATNETLKIHVGRGEFKDGEFVPTRVESFSLKFDSRKMFNSAESRLFSEQEARMVSQYLRALTQYAEDSVVWWDAGKGEREFQPIRY